MGEAQPAGLSADLPIGMVVDANHNKILEYIHSQVPMAIGIGTTDVVTLDFNPGNNRNRTKI
jgi:hypothetical protein